MTSYFAGRPAVAAIATLAALMAAAVPAAAADLAGRWSVSTLGGKPAAPAGDIRFQGGEISGATACNFFGGTFAAKADGSLTITVQRMTRRGCSGEAALREKAFLEAMASTRRYLADGSMLELMDEGGGILAELTAARDAALAGPRHKIVSYLHDGGLYSTSPDAVAHLQLSDETFQGSTGCTRFSGTFSIDGDVVRLVVTQREPEPGMSPCPQTLLRQDTSILAALAQAAHYDADRNLVRLLERDKARAVLGLTPVWR